MKVLPNDECIVQFKPLICHFKIREVKDTRRKYMFWRKVWKLPQDHVKSKEWFQLVDREVQKR